MSYCIYRHIRLDTNKTFYIGIGNDKRPYKKDRNKHWKNIVKKTEYEIQILKKDLSWEDAKELEIDLIMYYGRIDNNTGILCNMTNGGEGSLGITRNENTKSKLRKNNGYAKKVIDTATGIIYYSVADASRKTGITYGMLKRYLNGARTNQTTLKHLSHGQ